MTSEWTGDERREYCKICKQSTNELIKSACTKARIAMWLSGMLLIVCITATGISYSAKADVANQKEILTEIRKEQKTISHDLSQIAEFVNLLKAGKIVVHDHSRRAEDESRDRDNRAN